MKNLMILGLLLSASAFGGQWVTGYYAANNGVESVPNIPWNKYTQVIHFSAAPGTDGNGNGNGTVSMHYLVQSEINQINAAKPSGKQVLVGIADDGSHINAFGQDTAPGMIGTFVQSIVNFVTANGYDGVDIDWEANINVTQYENLITMLRGAMPTKTITVAAGNWGGMPNAIGAVSQDLDQVNVMCYDMDNQGASWYNDGLLQAGGSLGTCDTRVGQIMAAGVPAAKIGVGIPFYGRRNEGVTQPGVSGNFTQYTVLYRDLVNDSTRWQSGFMRYDTTHKADYLSVSTTNEFVSYNGTRSIGDAVTWAKSQGFGGFMTFDLDYEYLANASGDARYPLSSALYTAVSGGSGSGPNAPVLSSGAPSGTLVAGTTSATLSLKTNVNATCMYATTPGIAYSAMPYLFSVTGGTQHSTPVYNLQGGNSYTYYVKCTASGMSDSNDYAIAFSVASASAAPLSAKVSPQTGSGSSATFSLQISDNKGFAAIQQGALMIGNGNANGTCYIGYWAPTKTLSLQNDAGAGASTATVGASTTLANSQCSLDVHSVKVSGSGTTMVISLPVSFKSSYAGGKTLFTFGADASQLTGWKQSGTWIVK